MGMDDVKKELRPQSIFSSESGYVYTFSQVYKGVPVYDSTVSVSTDLKGNTKGLNSYYIPVRVNVIPSLTSNMAMNSSGIKYKKIITAELNIYIDKGKAKLAWKVDYKDSREMVHTVLIDARGVKN